MFSPERMFEVNALVLEEYIDKVSKEIINFGEFETKEVRIKDINKLFETEKIDLSKSSLLADLKIRLDKILIEIGEESLDLDSLSKEKIPMNIETLQERIKEIEDEFYSMKRELEKIEKEELEIRLETIKLQILENIKDKLSVAIEDTYTLIFAVPSFELEAVKKALADKPNFFLEIEKFKNVVFCLVVVPREYKGFVEKISVSFLRYFTIEDIKKNVRKKEELDEINRHISIQKQKILALIDEFKKDRKSEILELYKGVLYNSTQMKFFQTVTKKSKLILFSGWVPASRVSELEKILKHITNGMIVIETKRDIDVKKEDRNVIVPTKLNNPKFTFPFQGLVELFGIPRFYEIDPTVILAILYVVMYGMMFGDVGHGIVLALISAFIFLKFEKARLLGGLGISVGISSAIFGFLYGSVFGIEGKIIPHIWVSPLEDVVKILTTSISIGIFVIILGIILNVINTLRERDLLKLLLHNKGLAGLVFYSSIFGYPWVSFLTGRTVDTNIMLFGFLIPLLSFMTYFYLEAKLHGHSISLVSIFFEIFEILTSFVSNTLSFIRIAGFALNHAALSITFFSIANVLNNGTLFGTIIAGIVIVFGQIFIIVLEGFIVGIQTLRLNYYEFFSKFFRAGGKKFQPLE